MTRRAVLLRGGLGNQLFQWALGRRLQFEGHDVVLDDRLVRATTGRQIGVVDADIRVTTGATLGWPMVRRVHLQRTLSGYRIVEEPGFRYWPGVLSRSWRRVVFSGYWQSPKYFDSIAGDVRSAIRAAGEASLTGEGRILASQLTKDGSVSVHVRRGDYLQPAAVEFHGVLGIGYYQRAIDLLRVRSARRFYVFSDDPDWVARHLAAPDVTLVNHSVASHAIGEIFLMSLSPGHIVANSSFSWWGAWLPEDAHEVVAPDPWFLAAIDTCDLIPDRWRRLPGAVDEHGPSQSDQV